MYLSGQHNILYHLFHPGFDKRSHKNEDNTFAICIRININQPKHQSLALIVDSVFINAQNKDDDDDDDEDTMPFRKLY